MLGFISRLFGEAFPSNLTAKEVALKRVSLYYEACQVGIGCIGAQEKEEIQIIHAATNIYMLGVLDSASQRHGLSDKDFLELVTDFFKGIGVRHEGVFLLLALFENMASYPSAMQCIIEGGKNFNEWANGNSMSPLGVKLAAEDFYKDVPARMLKLMKSQ